jgi:hypothetical protein
LSSKIEDYKKKRSGPASQGLPQPIRRIGVAVFFERRQGASASKIFDF